MKFSLKRSFFFIFSLCISSALMAQAPARGRVYGIVLDANNKAPLEFATVVLRNLSDSSTTGGLTDEKGRFSIEPVKFGAYTVEINYLGYDTYKQEQVKVAPPAQVINLGEIKLSESASVLEAVEVVGEKSMFQLGGEKKIFNVDKNAMTAGGNAVDALKQIPTLDVTIDGNIAMRGSENIVIMINGKPSGLTGESRQAILESLPANSIESIEIINNPSAKYDADGTAGIINIVLKKNYNRGLNGNVNLGYTTKYKNNAGLSLNFKKNRINFTSNYNYRFWESFQKGNSLRKNFYNNYTNFINAYDYTRVKNFSGNINLSMDIEITEKAVLSFSNVFSAGGGKNKGETETEFLDAEELYYAGFDRYADTRRKNYNNDFSVLYRQNFAQQGRLLEVSGSINTGLRNNPTAYTQWNYDQNREIIDAIAVLEHNNNANNSKMGILQLDYTHPFRKHGKLEAGYKSTLRDLYTEFTADSLDRATGNIVDNLLLNNDYRYFEVVNAAYSSFGGTIKNFSYKLGLRMEQSNISIKNSQVEERFKNRYTDFFPSLFVSQKFKKSHEMQLSYSRRINRPNPWMLNPFADYSNPLDIMKGNPNMQPEYINALEFTYLKNWNAIFLTTTLYYRHVSDPFSRVRYVDSETSVATLTWANLDKAQNLGTEIIFRAPITKWWNVMTNINLYQNILAGNIPEGDNDLSTNSFQWNFRVQTGFKFWHNTDLQLSYRYNSRMEYLQGFIKPMHNLDIGLRKDVMKNKASIALNVQDLFRTRRFYVTNSGPGFESTADRRWETRLFTATFTYKFGKADANQKRRNNAPIMDDGGGQMMGF